MSATVEEGVRVENPNPLLSDWNGPFAAPPFSQVRAEHFRPAFDAALAEQRAEIAAIRDNPEPADFANTLLAMERAGKSLERVAPVFFHLASADTNDELEAIERDIAPILSRERSAIFQDEKLFARIDAVIARAEGLDDEQRRLVERYHLAFTRAGAALDKSRKERLAEIGVRQASLGAAFGQNVLADERDYLLLLDAADDLSGLPTEFLEAAQQTAAERGHAGRYAVTLSRSSVEPFLQFSARRDLREKVWRAFVARGANGGAYDNREIMNETLALRAEKAALLGYATFADFKLADSMAKTPENARDLLRRVWAPARAAALSEADGLSEEIAAEGGNFELQAWDWRYYAEKRRQRVFAFDEGALRAHLSLDNMIAAAFETARRLFGLTFVKRDDIDLPHPDARAWEVFANGRTIGVFIGDYFARSSKRSGAWMSSLRVQQRLDGESLPTVLNTMSFARGQGGACQLSYDEARTLFHEFGHALHGLMSDVTYPWLSGTAVLRDFVELPSQLYEHWLDAPEILARFARHHQTGEPAPKSLVDAALAARRYGQGFATTEFLASAFFDMTAHGLPAGGAFDAAEIERAEQTRLEMPVAIAPRHAAAHFQHVFAGDGYSSGYYSYLWSEALDADAFEAFEATGDVFNPALADKLKTYIYASGNRRAPEEAYAAFRGRAPEPDALLRKRGFA